MAETKTSFEYNVNKENIRARFSKDISLGLKIKAYSMICEDKDLKTIENLVLENNILKAASTEF